MKVYGILVKYPNGDKNINEAFTTKEKAKARIIEKIARKDIVTYENDYMYGDLEKMITYTIKEMEVE